MIAKHWKLCIGIVIFISVLCVLLSILDSSQDNTTSTPPPAEENRLTIFTSLQKDVYLPIVKEFENRTGIWVEVMTGDTLTELSKAPSQSPDYDLILGCHADSIEAYQQLFQSYNAPYAEINSDYVDDDRIWHPFSINTMVIIYNSKLVSTKPPRGWNSLLDPVWKGRIAMLSPSTSDIGYTALKTIESSLSDDSGEAITSFSFVLQDQTHNSLDSLIESVANGNYCIGIIPEDAALRAVAIGYDIKIVYPNDGTTAVPSTAAIFKQSKHTKNARLFIDFLLEESVQNSLEDMLFFRSAYNPIRFGEKLSLIAYDYTNGGIIQEQTLAKWKSLGEVQ